MSKAEIQLQEQQGKMTDGKCLIGARVVSEEEEKDLEKRIIDIFWENSRIRQVKKEDLAPFIKRQFEPDLDLKNCRRPEMERKARECLTADTLRLFSDQVSCFGLVKKDIAAIFGVGNDTVGKWDKESLIRQNGTASYYSKKTKVYSITSMLEAFERGRIERKIQMINELPLTDENIAEALYIMMVMGQIFLPVKEKAELSSAFSPYKVGGSFLGAKRWGLLV